jgi:methylated-DNA-[protein]-cysteine S-methyltransferase
MPFRDRVLAVVRRIPRGKTMTYKEVASAAGSPRACRAVGSFMKANRDARVPCHRVIRADFRPGEYNRTGGTRTKVRRLTGEGVRFEGGKVVRDRRRKL